MDHPRKCLVENGMHALGRLKFKWKKEFSNLEGPRLEENKKKCALLPQ
jgi:hypothetical protein